MRSSGETCTRSCRSGNDDEPEGDREPDDGDGDRPPSIAADRDRGHENHGGGCDPDQGEQCGERHGGHELPSMSP